VFEAEKKKKKNKERKKEKKGPENAAMGSTSCDRERLEQGPLKDSRVMVNFTSHYFLYFSLTPAFHFFPLINYHSPLEAVTR